jgi:membrane protein DedA with SNARE-associated domain
VPYRRTRRAAGIILAGIAITATCRAPLIELSIIRDKPAPFALSPSAGSGQALSKGVVTNKGFDKLSSNGVMKYGKINRKRETENGKSRMDHLTSLLAQYGLLLVFANVLLAQAGLPLPALPTLIVAGALARDGQLSLALVLMAAVAGSLLGDLPWYAAGRRAGYRVLRVLCRLSIEPDSCVKQTETTFERWGAPSLLVAKFIPGFSTVAPPVAGAMRLALPLFLIYSALGALLWAGAAVALGMIFHTQVDQVIRWLSDMGTLAFGVIAGMIGFYIAVKWVERRMFVRVMRAARITVDELQTLKRGGAPLVVLDVRSSTARRLDPRHIPGALPVNIAAPEQGLGAVSPDHDIVVYCS